jgi:tRNA threonylcarbamoyladenosine biosynthesis protein TsaB
VRIFAMDTSFDPCGMALADENGIVGSMTFRHERDLSRWWAPRFHWLLAEVGWKVEDLEGFAVCHGPGSFTGLRIGVTAQKTMSQLLKRPLVGISSLELIALPYRSAWPGTVVSVLYCRTGEVYRAAYGGGGAALREPAVVTVGELHAELADLPGPVLVSGGVGPKDRLELPPNARMGDPWLSLPNVERLALEGRRRLAEGGGGDPLGLTVLYLKRSQAEEQLEAFQRSKQGT